MKTTCPWLIVALLCFGCEAREQKDTPAQPIATPSASAVRQPEPAAPWFLGKWTSKFTTEMHRIEMTKPEGAVADWAKDDGKRGVGEATLELDVDADGNVAGTGDGALGKLLAVGQVSGDELRVQLSTPAIEASKAFSGLLLAARSGDVLKGKLQVSTGDSLVVRRAAVTLEQPKGAGAASPVSTGANPSDVK